MTYNNNLPNINETFIIDLEAASGGTSCDIVANMIQSCSGTTTIELTASDIIIDSDLKPINDNAIDLGSQIKRFRAINTVSGSSTVWTSTNANITNLSTTNINFGYDTSGNDRIATADTLILVDDTLACGFY